jgi:hypothetical protein
VQARRIALGDRTPVVLAKLGSDRYHPGSLASERPVLVVRWGLLFMVERSLSLSVNSAGVNSWVDIYNDHGSVGSGWCARAEESRSAGQLKLQQGSGFVVIASCGHGTGVTAALGFAVLSVDEVWLRGLLKRTAASPKHMGMRKEVSNELGEVYAL